MRRALVLVLALASTTAAADSAMEKARGHFKQGKAFQDAGAYERAAEQYKLAYEADPRPEMLFNIAQAFRLAKHKEQALDYFQQYLERQPDGAGADEARKHVVTLTKEIDEEKAARQAPPPTMLPPPAANPSPERRDEAPADAGRALRITGLTVAAAGVVALGVGVKFALDARSASSAISDHEGPWTRDDEQQFADGERANRNMKIMYAVGGALVVGGGLVYYLGARAKASPAVTTQSASLVVSGAF